MIHTGKFNPITGEEILQIEESDITFWEKEWEDLTIEQKADFCSLIKAPFLATSNEEIIKRRYRYYRFTNKKNPQLDIYSK